MSFPDAPPVSPPLKTKQPRNTKLTQQRLPAWKPVLRPKWVIFIFMSIGVVMIPIGSLCLSYGIDAKEVSVRYDNLEQCAVKNIGDVQHQQETYRNSVTGGNSTCRVPVRVPSDMKGPIYVYYELQNFYQNHRRYVKSRSDLQLVNKTGSRLDCEPLLWYGSPGARHEINPCGLIAWSFFNDTYRLLRGKGDNPSVTELKVQATNIALSSDKQHRYADYTASYYNTGPEQQDPVPGGSNMTVNGTDGPRNVNVSQNERFMVWMRVAALPRFRKLWGKIEANLSGGDTVYVDVYNMYNTYSFGGEKHIILGTTTWLGGRNRFLGIAYLVTGCMSILLGVVYWICVQTMPEKSTDPVGMNQMSSL